VLRDDHAHADGVGGPHDLGRDLDGEGLGEGGAVAEGPQVVLQRLRLDAAVAWDVVDHDARDVGLPGDGTHRGHLVGQEPDAPAAGGGGKGLDVVDRAADRLAEDREVVVHGRAS
jgi:hypothetical protein